MTDISGYTAEELNIYYEGYNDALSVVQTHIWRALKGSDLLDYANVWQNVMIGRFIEDVKAYYDETHISIKEAYKLAWQCARYSELCDAHEHGYAYLPEKSISPYDSPKWRKIPEWLWQDVQAAFDTHNLNTDPLERPFVERNPHVWKHPDFGYMYDPDPIPF